MSRSIHAAVSAPAHISVVVVAGLNYQHQMSIKHFLFANARLLAAGFLLALASSFGQTFFIAVFASSWRDEFDLSHGDFGLIYMVATLASATLLVQLGRLADSLSARHLAAGILLGLALICLTVAMVGNWIMLLFAIFGLRLFGQGFLSHLSQTAMARWFNNTRGRALAIASFGYPTGEALAPLAAIALIAAIGWRGTWGVAAVVLVFVFVPVLWHLLSRERTPREMEDTGVVPPTGLDGRHWSRGDVITHPLFWLIVPGIIAPSFILTVLFFLPAHIAETKGWPFEAMPSRYWMFALSAVTAAFISGTAIDRFSARACLPVYLLPMAVGLVVLWSAQSVQTVSVIMVLMGLTAGSASTINSALWAELYGTRFIGSVKALAHALMVFSTAIGPGFTGLVIDLGVPLPQQAIWFAAYALAISLLYLFVALRSARLVAGEAALKKARG